MPMSELRCIAEFKSASTLVRVKQGCDETRIELDEGGEVGGGRALGGEVWGGVGGRRTPTHICTCHEHSH